MRSALVRFVCVTGDVVKAFDNIGQYPWSVTIPLGQNYCH
jgi:hypothetical protein